MMLYERELTFEEYLQLTPLQKKQYDFWLELKKLQEKEEDWYVKI